MTQAPSGNLERTLAELAEGRALRQADLDGLSGLDRESTAVLRAGWSKLPDPARMTIAAFIHERAQDSIDNDYDAAALVILDDTLPIVRRFGVEALWETVDRHVGQRLIELLEQDDDDSVRSAAAGVLAGFVLEREFRHGDLAWGDRLVESLRAIVEGAENSIEVRAAALIAAAPRSEPWVSTALREAYYAEDRDYRLASVVAMGLTAQPMWLEYLYEQLQAEDPDFRKAAATACGEIAEEDSADPLADALEDEDPVVVVAAVAALAEIGGELAMEYLQEFRRRVPEELSGSLEEAIVAGREMGADVDADEEDDW